jgi:parvulin-like peptidyl-prolyl isomerase
MTTPNSTRRRPKSLPTAIVTGVCLALAGLSLAAGCSGGSGATRTGAALSASDFQAPPGQPGDSPGESSDTAAESGGPRSADATTSPRSRPAPGSYRVTRTGPIAESRGVLDITATPGEPASLAADATPVEAPVLINAKIGDINGRPVFVTDFFSTMDSRLKAEARNAKNRGEFEKLAATEIRRKLQDMVNEELLQAEARATLTPEQRQGFLAWIDALQSDFVSQNYGSRTIAEQRLSDSESAGTLERWKKDREQRELVLFQLREQVLRNVHVPFRDVELYYNRRYDEFNPAPKDQFRVIWIDERKTDLVASVKSELESGADFTEVASRPANLFRAKEGGLYIPPTPEEGKEAKFFEIPALNDAAMSLTPGNWTGPIDTGTTAAFLKREVITLPSTSLYDAQASIEQRLRSSRSEERMNEYIGDLMKRASVDNLDAMTFRLLELAMERYWTPTRRG